MTRSASIPARLRRHIPSAVAGANYVERDSLFGQQLESPAPGFRIGTFVECLLEQSGDNMLAPIDNHAPRSFVSAAARITLNCY